MNCRTVQNSLSAHLDGRLSGEQRRSLVFHLEACPSCESRRAQMVRLRSALRGLPATPPPARLSTALRVMASKERQRALARQRRLASTADRAWLWIENLMRPLALPFAGGLASAVLLFGMLLPTFTLHRSAGTDVPVALFTEPSIKAEIAFPAIDNGIDVDSVTVKVLVDSQGRMVDYSLPKGSGLENHPEILRALENKLLLFTQFTPATSFGQPTSGEVYVSFQRQSIDIKS